MSASEHILDVIGRCVRNSSQSCNNLQQFGRALQEERLRIPRETIRRIIAGFGLVWFVFNVPVNSYGHAETDSKSNHTLCLSRKSDHTGCTRFRGSSRNHGN